MPGKLLYKRGSDLGVVGGDKTYWICRTRQHVEENRLLPFEVQWFEREKGNGYSLTGGVDKISLDSVIKRVKLQKNANLFVVRAKDVARLEDEVDIVFNSKKRVEKKEKNVGTIKARKNAAKRNKDGKRSLRKPKVIAKKIKNEKKLKPKVSEVKRK